LKVSKAELEGKKVTPIPSEVDKFAAVFREQIARQNETVLVATSEVVKSIEGIPKVKKLWVNRDREGLIASVDVEHV